MEEEIGCLPFIPYLIKEFEDENEETPSWKTMVRACNGLFQNNSAPHSKSNMMTLQEMLKGDWKAAKGSKYNWPEINLEKPEPMEETGEGGPFS